MQAEGISGKINFDNKLAKQSVTVPDLTKGTDVKIKQTTLMQTILPLYAKKNKAAKSAALFYGILYI
jgi:hypothetical protein